jgi:hypothetical protein
MTDPESKAFALLRTIARMERYDIDTSDDAIEDAFETINGLIYRVREIVEDHDRPAAPFPEAEVPITLTGAQWTAVLARLVRPGALSEYGQRVYREATERLQKQMLAASDRHASGGTGLQEVVSDGKTV